MKRRLTLGLIAALPAAAQFDKILGKLGVNRPDGGGKSSAGLKEALSIATENAVKLIGRPDGFFKNELIKILMLEKLRGVEKALRMAGISKPLDEVVLSMNRAAESAAPLATKFFKQAILELTVDDARKVVTGGDTSNNGLFQGHDTRETQYRV